MRAENDQLLTRLTVKFRMPGDGVTLGSGIIYHSKELTDKIYVLTAAHVLFADGDKFLNLIGPIQLDFFSSLDNLYHSIEVESACQLFITDKDKDVAVIVIPKLEVENITGTLPTVYAVRDRQLATNFFLKGFPNATQGIELDAIYPIWKQYMTEVNKFQLTINEDYSDWSTGGFSGSGIFIHDNDQLYLFGIFARFRKQEVGKVIYAQYLETFNELLSANYLPQIKFVFFGQHGMSMQFFSDHVGKAVKNLGPRFNQDLNFRMPVVKLFNDLAKDEFFKRRILDSLHFWLLKAGKRKYFDSCQELDEVAVEHLKVVDDVRKFVEDIDWSPGASVELDKILEKIHRLGESASSKTMNLFHLQRELLQEKNDDATYGSKSFDREISLLRNIEKYNEILEASLSSIDLHLANKPLLLIQGEAGCGKSHLLGDIAASRISEGKPVLLLLGQNFRREKTIWENIAAQTDRSLGKDELLSSLNEIGKQIASRVLILVDALNEGAGKDLWPNELSGFIDDIGKYPFIGLALTIRTTYWKSIVPIAIQQNVAVRKYVHTGFKGNEYQALKLYCEHYGLSQPNFPILSPEFTNPLFLQLVCEGLKGSGEKEFPQGFQGFSQVFKYYLKTIHLKLSERRDEYSLKVKLVESAIDLFAAEAYKSKERMLPLDAAVTLFERHFANSSNLLMDLIQENVFIRTIYTLSDSYEEECIYFSYERFCDFFIARSFLEPFKNATELYAGFKPDTTLGGLIKEKYDNNGILETLAILIPEKFGVEITEVYDWCFISNDLKTRAINHFFNDWLMGSLKWRSTKSVVEQKILDWLKSKRCSEGLDEYYNRLIELTAVPGHPFNSDRLHRILMRCSMADRDRHFQKFLLYYKGSEGNEPYPLSRLLDWAWQPRISQTLDKETTRLVAQTLVWVLSTTVKKLRDQATKALVNLLEEQPEVLVKILIVFREVDDTYILERLFAVAYGCVLRTTSEKAIEIISQQVYDQIFNVDKVPAHVLLRDYARNTVEYALYRQVNVTVDPNLIRPPYKSDWPDQLPSKEDVDVFYIKGEHINWTSDQVRIFNSIHVDTISWDFSNKVIEPAFSDFIPQRFTIGLEYKSFLRTLPVKKRSLLKTYLDIYVTYFKVKEVIRVSTHMSDESLKERQNFITKGEEVLLNKKLNFENYLDQVQVTYIKEVIIPYLEDGVRQKNGFNTGLPVISIKAWIVKRAHELGYDIQKHYDFDSIAESYKQSRYDSVVDRIGEKYQRIAFYEVFGLTADHFKMKKRYSRKSIPQFYEGPWQKFLRDIDPIFITRRGEQKDQEEESDDLGVTRIRDEWWIDQNYTYWSQDNASWVRNSQDLPDAKQIIQRTDEYGVQWIYLGVNANWNEPVPFGEDKYNHVRKQIWYMFSALLVKKQDKAKTFNWLRKQNFGGRWLPEPDQVIGLCNRENYWSPIVKAENNRKSPWIRINDSRIRVILTTNEAVGEMSEDKSGAHFGYFMPSQVVFEGMGLHYAIKDGDFVNQTGEIVVINTNPKGVMVRKQDFLNFLEEHNFDVIWTLLGEKSAIGSSFDEFYRTTISGVYTLNDKQQIVGDFKITENN